MSAIKLLEIESVKIQGKTTRRFQSQLQVGTDSADFVMREDNVMMFYDYGEKGYGFYPYNKAYEIVDSIEDMKYQPL